MTEVNKQMNMSITVISYLNQSFRYPASVIVISSTLQPIASLAENQNVYQKKKSKKKKKKLHYVLPKMAVDVTQKRKKSILMSDAAS